MNFGPKRTGRGIGRVLVGLGALMSLAMIPASAVTNLTGEYTFTTNTDPYAILAFNYNTASGSYGVQANSYAAAGSGIYGYSDVTGGAVGYGVADISQTGYGVYGSSYGAGISAIYAENLGTGGGIGMQGTSAYGVGINGLGAQNGVVGETTSTSSASDYAGVYGIDASSGAGVVAYGVYGQTASNTGVLGIANGSGYGVTGSSTGSFGVFGEGLGYGGGFEGYSGAGVIPALAAAEGAPGTDLFGTYGYSNSGSGNTFPENFIIQASSVDNSGNSLVPGASDVQISGDVYVDGAVFTGCTAFPETSPFSDCDDEIDIRKSSTGANLKTYSAHQSMSSMEDFGEGALVNGHGYVPLDRAFASSIAQDRPYLVFLTPEGDSNGLFVTGRSLAGFTVRESKGGRSSIGFTYRIVAQPFGVRAVRMAAIAPGRARLSARVAGRQALWPKTFKSRMMRPAAIGSRVTRPPHIWVKNMHRS